MASAFDDQAPAYDRWYATPLGRLVDRLEKEALFRLLPQISGLRLLEVGCGTGNISRALARKGARVVGLDASGPMLARAQDRTREEGLTIDWLQGQASALPCGAGSFDGVLGILALDFMADREGALQEMVRVLRPGGLLAVAMLNRYSLWTLKRVVRAWLKPSLWRQVRFITARELRLLLSGHPELADIRGCQAIYFPPWQHPCLVRYYPYLERLGQKLHLLPGAFLAVVARKESSRP